VEAKARELIRKDVIVTRKQVAIVKSKLKTLKNDFLMANRGLSMNLNTTMNAT